MTIDELQALGLRLQNAAVQAIQMRASVRPAQVYSTGKFLYWECWCFGPMKVRIIVQSHTPDAAGWCEAIEQCHERWVAAVRSAPS
jgi:hypothetical protein